MLEAVGSDECAAPARSRAPSTSRGGPYEEEAYEKEECPVGPLTEAASDASLGLRTDPLGEVTDLTPSV